VQYPAGPHYPGGRDKSGDGVCHFGNIGCSTINAPLEQRLNSSKKGI
jgi:hypothetical protein